MSDKSIHHYPTKTAFTEKIVNICYFISNMRRLCIALTGRSWWCCINYNCEKSDNRIIINDISGEQDTVIMYGKCYISVNSYMKWDIKLQCQVYGATFKVFTEA